MTERERLIELLCEGIQDDVCIAHCNHPPCCKCEVIADHLLSNGVIVPPCKVGRIVYVLRSKTSNGKNLYLREERIDHYRVFGDWSFMCFESGRLSVPSYLWETTVFLTKEEAEAKLKERSEGK